MMSNFYINVYEKVWFFKSVETCSKPQRKTQLPARRGLWHENGPQAASGGQLAFGATQTRLGFGWVWGLD